MRRVLKNRPFGAVALVLPALLMTACVEYTIETTVNPDGSGFRAEHMEVGENSEVNLEPRHFQALTHVTGEEGWVHAVDLDSDGDTVHVFDRGTEIPRLSDWSKLNGKVRIEGALRTSASAALGYVTLENVRFHNVVNVRRASDSDGPTTLTYRETFVWDQAVDALVEFLLADLDDALVARFPNLTASERGQVEGFARARLWIAIESGLLSDDADEDQLMDEVVRETLAQSIKIVRVKHPRVTEELLERILTESLVDTDERLEVLLEEHLPGLNIAINSEIIFRLNMPGRVTHSNAHRRDGGTLVWEFGPADALHTPVEIFAESMVAREG